MWFSVLYIYIAPLENCSKNKHIDGKTKYVINSIGRVFTYYRSIFSAGKHPPPLNIVFVSVQRKLYCPGNIIPELLYPSGIYILPKPSRRIIGRTLWRAGHAKARDVQEISIILLLHNLIFPTLTMPVFLNCLKYLKSLQYWKFLSIEKEVDTILKCISRLDGFWAASFFAKISVQFLGQLSINNFVRTESVYWVSKNRH